MVSILGALILSASIVISREEIALSLPAGTSSDEVTSYLTSVGGSYTYFTRKTERIISPRFPWTEAEVGYYFTYIENVKKKWWLPSFGGGLRVRVGITETGESTQVIIHESVRK